MTIADLKNPWGVSKNVLFWDSGGPKKMADCFSVRHLESLETESALLVFGLGLVGFVEGVLQSDEVFARFERIEDRLLGLELLG